MSDEVTTNCRIARAMLACGDNNDLATQIADAIANLLTLAHEEGLNPAEAVTKGAAHWAATYIEFEDDHAAEEWLSNALFPFTGERQFAEYIAERAIILAGKDFRVSVPEWGV